MHAKFVAAAAVLLFALAGCGSKEPTGKIESLNFSTPVAGSATFFYQPFTNGGNPVPGGLPGGLNETCAQNTPGAPADPSGTIKPCKGPYTTISVSIADLFDPGTFTYGLYLTGPGQAARPLGAPTTTGSNSTFAANITANLDKGYDKIELRLNDFLYATAPVTAGTHAFTLAAGVNGLTVTGTFTGHSIDVVVGSLPATNETYMGMLYLPNPDGSVSKTPAEMFPIGKDGTYHYESKAHGINEFAQFHVHVGTSKLNLYKSSIKTDA